jgi:DNA recombination protein RmuC
MVLTIILSVLALAVGILIGWLLMRPRQASLTTQLEFLQQQRQQDLQDREANFQRQLQLVKEQMQNETRQVLDQRAEALGKSNREQMSDVVKPLKEQLEAVQKQVKATENSSTANRASIEKAIEDLVKRTIEMSNDARGLTRALQGDNRAQGNWGELVLETILGNSGLEKGVHYETQVTLRDADGRALSHELTGQRMVPDVIVHYPDDKDVIIDSKVSLTAYLDYCNAQNDAQRDAAAQRHVASMRQHVRELRLKNYASYIKPPRQALQYMLMFVPNEAALQLALQTDSSLWREAFDSGICITSEQNLIVLLRMIQMAWAQVQQFHNQQEIIAQATVVLDRVQRFVDRLDRVNSSIDRLHNDYEEARRAFDGRQGILAAAKSMERLGAKTSQQRLLPEPTEE